MQINSLICVLITWKQPTITDVLIFLKSLSRFDSGLYAPQTKRDHTNRDKLTMTSKLALHVPSPYPFRFASLRCASERDRASDTRHTRRH